MKICRVFVFVVSFSILAVEGYGLTVQKGEDVDIPADAVIDDDLVVFASSVTVHGHVTGDVYAFARDVTIRGTIDGALFAGAEQVTLEKGSARTVWAAGRTVDILDDVASNVIIAGAELTIGEGADIGKDVRAYGGELRVDGNINGNLKGAAGDFIMTGSSGQVKMNVDEARIAATARVTGDLILKTREGEPVVEDGAIVTGETMIIRSDNGDREKSLFVFASAIAFFIVLFKIICFIAKIVVGVLLIALFKNFVRQMMDTLIRKPWWSLLVGFLTLIVVPMVVVLLFCVLIGWPLAVFGLYVYTVLFYLASIFISLVLGEKILQLFKKDGEVSLYLSFIVGLVILTLVGFIPIVRHIINLCVLLFGVGMLAIGMWDFARVLKKKGLL